MKYFELIDEFLKEARLPLPASPLVAIGDYANWLDTHGPTLRAADQTAIELLQRLAHNLASCGGMTDELRQDIDAVLNTAAGG